MKRWLQRKDSSDLCLVFMLNDSRRAGAGTFYIYSSQCWEVAYFRCKYRHDGRYCWKRC